MPIDLYLGYVRGVNSVSLAEGEGVGGPRLSAAVALTINKIELSFSEDMDYNVLSSKILDVESYELIRVSDSQEQTIVRVTDDRDYPSDVPGVRKVILHVQNQEAVTYQVRVVGEIYSAYGELIDPAFDTVQYTGATPVQPTGGSIYTFYGLDAGMQAFEQQTYPPILVTTPTSPNPDITDPTHPMEWRTEDLDSTSSIALLQIEGMDVVVNNVLQPGFTGTVVANGQGGWDVSIVANNDYWPGQTRIDWTLKAADLFNIVNFAGSIDKYITLPYPDEPVLRPALINTSFDFPFRFTSDGDVVTARDEKSIEDNMKASVMLLKGGIPLYYRLGSRVPLMPFDPNDQATYDLIAMEIVEAVRFGEFRVVVDERSRVITDESGNAIAIVTPYVYKASMGGWKDFRLEEPEFLTVDKANPRRF